MLKDLPNGKKIFKCHIDGMEPYLIKFLNNDPISVSYKIKGELHVYPMKLIYLHISQYKF